MKNGTYSYLVNLPPGYSATPKAGKLYWNNTFIVVNASSPIGYETGNFSSCSSDSFGFRNSFCLEEEKKW
ncbi:MAG: hypothetical protein QXU98_14735 [Candidatus Parvarchaeota archaeon]